MSSQFAPLPAHVAQAVEDSLEAVEELRRISRSCIGLRPGTTGHAEAQVYAAELSARVSERACLAGISTDELLQHCNLRIALEESHAAKARKVAA